MESEEMLAEHMGSLGEDSEILQGRQQHQERYGPQLKASYQSSEINDEEQPRYYD